MNWNGTYWGLVRHIGPYAGTAEDERRANSRSGGPHAGHGNWMQTFNPSRNGDGDARVYQPEQMYSYSDGAEPVVTFDVLGERIAKVPGSRIGYGAKRVAGKRGFTDTERYTNNVTTRTELGHDLHYQRGFNGGIPRRRPRDDGSGVPVHLREFDLSGNDRRGSVKPDLNLETGRRESMFEERASDPVGTLATEATHVTSAVERKIAKLRKHAKAHASFLVQPGGGVKRRINEPPSARVKRERISPTEINVSSVTGEVPIHPELRRDSTQ